MNELETMNTVQTIDSREVALMVEKEHKDLLRDIRRYEEQLGESNLAPSDFFVEDTYKSSQNKTMPCYLVTRKGCEFIANKLTGAKGTAFTAKYINRFHEMEQTIKTGTLDRLSPELKAIIAHDLKIQDMEKKVAEVDDDLQDFKKSIPLFGVECEIITNAVRAKGIKLLGGKDTPAYNDKSVRGKVYSDLHMELKRQFGVTSYKAIRRNQCDTAVRIIEAYRLPMVLKELVDETNAQLAFEETGEETNEP